MMEREAREASPPSMNLLSEWYGKCFMQAIPFGLCQPSDEQLRIFATYVSNAYTTIWAVLLA
jgi:hypothetical protein